MKYGLILSGGAAKGLAHIYIIDLFKKYGFPIDVITGSSAGSIVAAMYAYGMDREQMEESFKKIENLSKNRWKFLTFKSIFKTNGFFTTQPIFDLFNNDIFNKVHIEDLKTPFGAVTTDLDSGEAIYLTEGNLASAVTYSMSFPILFNSLNGRFFDGGLTANCPAFLAKQLGADKLIAVDLKKDLPNESSYRKSKIKTTKRLISIMWSGANREDIMSADVVIRPHVNLNFFDFGRFEDAKISAEIAFKKSLPELRKIYEK